VLTLIKNHAVFTIGYVGGSVLSALLRHPRLDEFNITVLVRSEVKASRLGTVRVSPVIGSREDSTLLKNLASQAEVVIACVRTIQHLVFLTIIEPDILGGR
jgi:uncharacterized protein YbjT (DUF2867 family)